MVLTYIFNGVKYMNINVIKMKVLQVLSKHQLKLFDMLEEKMGKEKILTVLIDEEMDHNVLEPIHMEILDLINDDLPDDYFLQVSTVGIEKPLRSLEEVKKEVGGYVFIESDLYIGNATIEAVVDNVISISFFQKGRPKKLDINYQTIRFIRQAVKF